VEEKGGNYTPAVKSTPIIIPQEQSQDQDEIYGHMLRYQGQYQDKVYGHILRYQAATVLAGRTGVLWDHFLLYARAAGQEVRLTVSRHRFLGE
jgi:hypothetical protein